MAGSAKIIEVERLSKAFGVVQALNDVTLGFHAGELLGLVGENGAGKSTFMRLLEGVYAPDSGSIKVDGVAHTFREPKDAHVAGIRVIHQEPDIVPDLTVAENIFVGAMPRRLGLDARLAQARRNDARGTRQVRHGRRPAPP